MASSKGASTSSSIQNGDGLAKKKENVRATAVRAFSPPEHCIIFLTSFPGGCALISTPVSNKLFSSVRIKSASPPPNNFLYKFLKYSLTSSNVFLKFTTVVSFIFFIVSSKSLFAFNKSFC